MTTENEINNYYNGMLDCLYRFAWMKDGVYYVGTTGKTYKQAQQEIEEERVHSLKEKELPCTTIFRARGPS